MQFVHFQQATTSTEENSSAKPSPNDEHEHNDDDFIEFDWHSYVVEQGLNEATLASPDCFNQQREPPMNVFEEDMKLEMKDPRG